MSETMAIESIAEEYAKFLGYFTETRVPFKLKSGNNSDIDVLGYNPITKKTLMIECKAGGGPEQYFNYTGCTGSTDEIPKAFNKMINDWKYFTKSNSNKWKLNKLNEMWYVIPGYCTDNIVIEKILYKKFGIEVKIIPIHKLILDIMGEVNTNMRIRRKRYSNPALELCRWLVKSYEKKQLTMKDIEIVLNNK